MTRTATADDLLGPGDVADMLGIGRTAFSNRCARGRFPEPFARTSSGPIWHRDDVEAIVADEELARYGYAEKLRRDAERLQERASRLESRRR